MSRADIFTVELTEAELLNAWLQSERALFDTLDDIDRGRCTGADAVVLGSLYRALCKVVYARPRISPVAEGTSCCYSPAAEGGAS